MQQSAVNIINASSSNHPAVTAWNRIMSCDSPQVLLTTLKDEGCTTVHRLHGIAPNGENVIAKRCLTADAMNERAVYQDVLARLPLPALRCYGIGPDHDPQFAWLFLEDAGEECYSPDDMQQRAAFSRWLAILHTCAARIPAAALLPDRGPGHYRVLLASAVRQILHCLSNPALRKEDRLALDAILLQCELVQSHWKHIEEFCDDMPRTLVHGDFAAKNVRVRVDGSEVTLKSLDWATAGWAVTAADLDGNVDLDVYWSGAREAWPHLHLDDLKQLAACGEIFRVVAAVEWSSLSLEYEWIDRPMGCMRAYQSYLANSIQAMGWGG